MSEAESKSRLEEIIGDLDGFKLLLNGAFKDWQGSYDVWLVDQNCYLFNSLHVESNSSFPRFCRYLRSTVEGESLCSTNDKLKVKEKASGSYFCHAGLIEITIPIIVEENHIATIFCGKVRSTDPAHEQKLIERVISLERVAGFHEGSLAQYSEKVQAVDQGKIDATIIKVKQVVDYIVNLATDRLQLKKARLLDEYRISISEILVKAYRQLGDLSLGWDEYWEKTSELLNEINSFLGATCSLILLPRRDEKETFIVTALAGLPESLFKARLYTLPDSITHSITEKQNDHAAINYSYPVRKSIIEDMPLIGEKIDTSIRTTIRLDEKEHGFLVFFLSNEESVANLNLKTEEEVVYVEQLSTIIGLNYNNRLLFEEQKRVRGTQTSWLQNVTHQLLAPLNALQGHAENIQLRLDHLEQQNPDLFLNWQELEVNKLHQRLEDIINTSYYAIRIARNLSRIAYRNSNSILNFRIISDVSKLFIEYARQFQGFAATRELKLSVNKESCRILDNRLSIIDTDDLFKQSVSNLIDNAVKYSYPKTEIRISARRENQWGIIIITNEGVQIKAEDQEKIFDYNFRTEQAKREYAAGTGIGLSVARDFIHLHGGKIIVIPSIPGAMHGKKQGWVTSFEIYLPLDTI